MQGRAADCVLLPWVKLVECLWEIWQGKDDDLNFHRFGGRHVCNQKGALPFSLPYLIAVVCTLQRGVLRRAWSGNGFPSDLPFLRSMPEAWPCGNNQLLAVPTDLCTSLPLLMPVSPSEMSSALPCLPCTLGILWSQPMKHLIHLFSFLSVIGQAP